MSKIRCVRYKKHTSYKIQKFHVILMKELCIQLIVQYAKVSKMN